MANIFGLAREKVDEARDKLGGFFNAITYTESGSGSTKRRNLDVAVNNTVKSQFVDESNVAIGTATNPLTSIGLKLKAAYTQTTNSPISVTGKAVAIENKSSAALTLTINEIDVVVEPDMIYPASLLYFGDFTSIAITATGNWQLFVYE